MASRWLAWAFSLAWLAAALPVLAQPLAPIPALDSPVVDATGTLDAAQKQRLQQQALQLQQRKGSQLQLLLVASTQPETIEQYTQRVFDQWQLGRKGVDDGVLLVVAKDDRRVRIQPGYGLEGAIPDAIANRIIQEYLAPKFRQGDYAGGIEDATAMLVRLIDGESLPAPVSGHDAAPRGGGGGGGGWIVALLIGFVVANIARGIISALPRPLRALLTGGAAGLAALLFTSLLLASGAAALVGLLL
ncbi:MAG TPA: dehydrogenase, partial [Xanthomonadaceae bacterium]|nr:dehydrogenase [Xanthomonadaceae bacterium]